jgi:hypothetical protein
MAAHDDRAGWMKICPARRRSTPDHQMARISSIVLDRHEHPRRATILTRLGTVKVEWRDVCGDRCWFTSGILDAKKLTGPALERFERMVAGL